MTTAPVLLWGSPQDVPLAAVCTALAAARVPMFLLDPAHAHEATVDADPRDGRARRLRTPAGECTLEAVRGVLVRAGVGGPGDDEPGRRRAEAVDGALAGWLEEAPARVLNRPSAAASNGSKPYQALRIRAAGLTVPDTLLTNDADAARAFVAQHGTVVYKSCSAVRSIVSRLASIDDARLARLATCPVQFQQYVPGPDYRVHVIGDELFGHEIGSTADDYRYAPAAAVRLRPWRVPAQLAERLRALAAALRLPLAGIDLRRTAEGEWHCFEVNPSPAFTFFDHDDGQPLACATARLLAGD